MLIGISGKKQSGKDLVGNIIQYILYKRNHERTNDHSEEEFKRFEEIMYTSNIYQPFEVKKFADKVKDIICLLINCTRKQLEDDKFKNTELGEEWWYYAFGGDPNIKTPTVKIDYLDNGYSEDDISKMEKYLIKPTPRMLLQQIGTDCGREIIHPNIWVNSTMLPYKQLHTEYYQDNQRVEWVDTTPNKVVIPKSGKLSLPWDCVDVNDTFKKVPIYPDWIITDVRFPNELKSIEDRGGFVIRVNRPKDYSHVKDKTTRKILENTPNIGLDNHPSETGLDNHIFKHVIVNNGTIKELILKVQLILTTEGVI